MPDLSATVSPLLKRRDIFGFIQGQRVPRGTFNYRTRERSRLVPRFISMYDLGNPAAAILISSLLPLVNRSREKYACYSRLIRARVGRKGEKGFERVQEGGEKKKEEEKTVQFVSSTLRSKRRCSRIMFTTIFWSRFVRLIVNDCPASRRCLLIHRHCL